MRSRCTYKNNRLLAERVGFEPTVRRTVHRISSPEALTVTLCAVEAGRVRKRRKRPR